MKAFGILIVIAAILLSQNRVEIEITDGANRTTKLSGNDAAHSQLEALEVYSY